MKGRISCFGHGWACEVPGKTFYVGSFPEAWAVFDEYVGQIAIAACLDVYRSRMGTEAQTRGMA